MDYAVLESEHSPIVTYVEVEEDYGNSENKEYSPDITARPERWWEKLIHEGFHLLADEAMDSDFGAMAAPEFWWDTPTDESIPPNEDIAVDSTSIPVLSQLPTYDDPQQSCLKGERGKPTSISLVDTY